MKGKEKNKDIIGIKAEPLEGLMGAYKYSKDDWSTVAFILDKTLIENTAIKFAEPELLFNCIYFLGGTENNIEKIYVGQAKKRNSGDSVLPRLREHAKSNSEKYRHIWKYAIIVTNAKDTWGPTELNVLEHIFYNEIPKENNLNGNNPNAGVDKIDDDYAEKVKQITAYLTAVGLRTFSNTEDAPKIQVTEERIQKVEDLQRGLSAIPEIVTPDKVVKQMIDMLPEHVWNDKTVFLDPACKGGEFLRAIFDRLMETESLRIKYKDELARAIHILDKQVYGIALSEVSRDRAIRKLNGYDKNIIVIDKYIDILKDKTRDIEAFKKKLAYEFGRENMNFDVVIGNPPYQESNGAGKNGGSAIWNRFVTMGIALVPKYICMITPSRWFTGGMGLNQFRTEWLNDKRIRTLVHFPIANKIFPGTTIAGGVSYFLWDSSKTNPKVAFENGETLEKSYRVLNRFDVLLADNMVESIVEKIDSYKTESMSSIVGRTNQYGLSTTWSGISGEYAVITSQGMRRCGKGDLRMLPEKYRVILSSVMSEHGNEASKDGTYRVFTRMLVADEKTACNSSYLPIGPFEDTETTQNCIKYLKTKFVRSLVRVRAIGIHLACDTYKFVPLQDFTSSSDIDWSKSISEIDQQLYKKYNLTPEEIAYIEKTIKAME